MEENTENTQANEAQQSANANAAGSQQNTNAAPASGNSKNIAIIAYITIIGWIIAMVMEGNENPKTSLAGFHLRQALGIMLAGLAGYIVLAITIVGLFLSPLWSLFILIVLIIGLISAINGEEKPVFFLGNFFQKILKGIK